MVLFINILYASINGWLWNTRLRHFLFTISHNYYHVITGIKYQGKRWEIMRTTKISRRCMLPCKNGADVPAAPKRGKDHASSHNVNSTKCHVFLSLFQFFSHFEKKVRKTIALIHSGIKIQRNATHQSINFTTTPTLLNIATIQKEFFPTGHTS